MAVTFQAKAVYVVTIKDYHAPNDRSCLMYLSIVLVRRAHDV